MFFGRGKKKRHGESSTTSSPPSRKPILNLTDMLRRIGSPDIFDSAGHRSAKHLAADRGSSGHKSSSFLNLLAPKPRPSLSTPDLTLKARESANSPHAQPDDPMPMPRVSTSTPASPTFNPPEKMTLNPLKSPNRPISLDLKAANMSIPSTPRDPFPSPKVPSSPRIPRTPTRRISYQNDSSYLHKRSKSSSSITLPLAAYSKRSSGGINLPVIVTAATEQKQQTRQNSYPHIIAPRHPYQNHSNSSTPALPTSVPEPTASRPASMNGMPDDLSQTYTDVSSPRRASLFPPSANGSAGKVSKRPVLKLTALNTNPHHSSGFVSLAIKRSLAIQPDILAQKLSQGHRPLLIDIRALPEYQKLRIRGSLNVNLPTLLIKRYRRGTISNFNLESFITTPNGRQRYLKRLSACSKEIDSIREEDDFIVVFDDCMDEEDKTSHAWTLVGVLEKAILENTVSGAGERARVLWLKGGYEAFEKYDHSKQHLVSGQQEDEEFDKADLATGGSSGDIDMSRLSLTPSGPVPRRSVSSTLGAISNINTTGFNQRRMSLFTLDTQATRSRRDFSHNLTRPLVTTEENGSRRLDTVQQHTLEPPTAIPELNRQQRLLHLLYDEDDSPRTGAANGSPPVSDGEFSFIISEIITGFLFVGPEIATVEQMNQLQDRKIRRILNMAEECDDDVPGLKDKFLYKKIAARDTVEMRNVERCLREAVECIGRQRYSALNVILPEFFFRVNRFLYVN